MNPMIIHYSPGPFSYYPEIWKDFSETNKVRIGIDSKLKCSPDSDNLGLQIDILVKCGDKTLLTIGLLFAFRVKDFGNIIKEDPKLVNHMGDLEKICEQAWYATIGVVAARTVISADDCPDIPSDAPIRSGFILPPVSIQDFAKDISIVTTPED